MLKAGKIAVWLGVIITLVGLVGGFSLMTSNAELSKIFLMSIPLGFLLLFSGAMTGILFGETVTPRRPE